MMVSSQMAMKPDEHSSAAGLAALSICESLILALSDMNVLSEKQAVDVLKDAIAGHHGAIGAPENVALHQQAAKILERILDGGNSIRRP